MTPEELIRPDILKLTAYHVPPAQGLIKLDAMENPYSWPETMVADWLEQVRVAALNRYPSPNAPALKQALRNTMTVPESCDLLLGNGSDELIQLLALALASPDRVILAPEPSFVMYRMIASFVGMRYVGVPLRSTDFALDETAMLAAIEQHRPVLIFLSYPNNPTGNLFDHDAIMRIIRAAPGLVVIDEAYFCFTDYSFMAELPHFDNLLVMRTVSKMGLAGLRLGFLAGAKQWLTQFDKLRLPYNINVLTQLSTEFALANKGILDAQVDRIRVDRQQLETELAALPKITVFPSEANFILLRVAAGTADQIAAALLEAGVLIKNLHHAHPLLHDCLRITVGTEQENQVLLTALQTALTQGHPAANLTLT